MKGEASIYLTSIKSKYQSVFRPFRTIALRIRRFVLSVYWSSPMIRCLYRLAYRSPSMIRRFPSMTRRFALLVYQSRRLARATDPVPQIRHLAFSVGQAISEVIVNNDTNEKIKEGYFADRLVIVVSLPKVASKVIAGCIARIQSKSGVGTIRYAGYTPRAQDADLRPELTRNFPQGGIMNRHTRATGRNLEVLDLLGVKYLILLRHPVDQLVSLYCHVRGHPDFKDAIEKDHLIYDPIYPMNGRWFQDGSNLNETIRYMIREGYLNAALSWIIDWLRFRDVNRSLVIKYEDFVTKPNETLNNISNFLYGRELDEEMLMECNSIAEAYASTQPDANTRKYPHGWTGKIGIWKSYLSDENKKDYLSVVRGFLNYYPNALLLMDVYPNLLDIDNL